MFCRNLKGIVLLLPLLFFPSTLLALEGSPGEHVSTVSGETITLDTYIRTDINCNGDQDGWSNLHYGKTHHVRHEESENCSPGQQQFAEYWHAHVSEPVCEDVKDQAEIVCGAGNVIFENEETCEFHCAECDDEYQAAVAECGDAGFSQVIDCDYTCKCENLEWMETYCEDKGGLLSHDIETCTPVCDDCSEVIAELSTVCPNGLGSIDYENCDINCYDCDSAEESCATKCESDTRGYDFTCNELDPKESDCECRDTSCSDNFKKCAKKCLGQNFDFSCPPLDPDNYTCVCKEPDDPVPPTPDPPDVPDSPIEPDPVDPDPENPNDLGDVVGWLTAIKGNTDTMIEQNDDDYELQDEMNENTKIIVKNQGIEINNLKGVNQKIAASNEYLDGIESGVSSLDVTGKKILTRMGRGHYLAGSAELPSNNEYDGTFSSDDQLEEESLTDAIQEFITSGIPILSYINGTSLNLSGASPTFQATVWNRSIIFDMSPFEGVLNVMGYVLSGLSVIVGFGIITGRS